ncbi:MAG: YbjN domain-containing protein [Saprospiraceae bacterium]|nr:YbjN domain-containing protein [Saprospiraceae bacterium]
MFKKILSYFDNQNWKYHVPEPTKTLALLGIGTDSGKYHCIADVDEDSHRFIFFSVCPTNVPSAKRREMAELIIRINYNLFLGNFELDFEDGEIRFKTSIIYESIELTPTIIDNIITSNLFAMDKNIAIITTFAFGGLSIKEAIKKIKYAE